MDIRCIVCLTDEFDKLHCFSKHIIRVFLHNSDKLLTNLKEKFSPRIAEKMLILCV